MLLRQAGFKHVSNEAMSKLMDLLFGPRFLGKARQSTHPARPRARRTV